MDDRTLGHVLSVIAHDLEQRGFPHSGPLRQAARRLFELETDGCAICGDHLDQPATGRPRKYCSPACRQLAWRVTKAAK